jgi:hypothetical protein
VIGDAIDGVHKLKPVLCVFDPAQKVRKCDTERKTMMLEWSWGSRLRRGDVKHSLLRSC